MKRHLFLSKFKSLSSFTLVELLVVMAIIAILVGVLLSAVQGALNAAKRAKAANTAIGIQTAVMSYYTEYSVYPTGSASGDLVISDASGSQAIWGAMIEMLSGNLSPYSPSTAVTQTTFTNNTRGIAFISMKASDVDLKDAPLNPITTNNVTNPYFNMAIDGDYDGTLGVAGNSKNLLPNFANTPIDMTGSSTAGVAVWANCNTPKKNNPNWYVHTY